MWNQIYGNKICADRTTIRSQQRHLNKVQSMKPRINNTAPYVPAFLQTKAKQEKIKQARQEEINYGNMKLLRKMMEIENKPSSLNPLTIKKTSFTPTRSLGVVKKLQEWQKINDENRSLIQRLQSTHSMYNVKLWENEDRKRKTLQRNISQNARRFEHIDFAEEARLSLSRPGTSTTTAKFSSSKGFNYQPLDQP